MNAESGLVLRVQSGFYRVLTGDGIITCRIRGKLKQGVQYSDLVAIGDRVQLTRLSKKEGVIELVQPRAKVFSRLDPRPQGVYEQVLLANPDQLLMVFACTQPDPHLRMLDRFLVIAEQQGIPPIIISNKCDLVGKKRAKELFGYYEPLGYRLIYTSAKTKEGIDEVREVLRGKISALTGPSGVGKSSLIACIQPGLDLRSGRISSATGKGMHTTEVRELYCLSESGYIADMPGLRALALWNIQPEELDGYFPEMRERIDACQYNDCSHRSEPGCSIRAAVTDGKIHPERYKSYLSMR
ncbi:MAG: ribosome small subunit-dependent GTPase A, partial [Anaerolineaceae bacterium]